MDIRAVFNKKGGVGKTTITCNLAAMSAYSGKKTLVIDLDPQSNATQYLLSEEYPNVRESGRTILDYYRQLLDSGSAFGFNPFLGLNSGGPEPASFIHKTVFKNLSIVPSHPDLSELEGRLVSRHKIFKLRELIQQYEDFDAIYIDTPPAMNFFSLSALIAASKCLIPFDCDTFSKDAIFDVGKHIADIKNDHNSELEVEGVVVNQYLARANFPARIVEGLEKEGVPVLTTRISSSVKVRESHHSSVPLIYMQPRHKLTGEFQALYDEITAKS